MLSCDISRCDQVTVFILETVQLAEIAKKNALTNKNQQFLQNKLVVGCNLLIYLYLLDKPPRQASIKINLPVNIKIKLIYTYILHVGMYIIMLLIN